MSAPANRRRAFTLVELLVVIGIIAVLVAMLLPSLNKARQASLAVACSSNLRQIGVAEQAYVIQYKGYLPHGNANNGINSWTAKIAPFTLGIRPDQYNSLQLYKVYSCPVQPDVPHGFKCNAYLGVVGGGDAADPLQPYKISQFKKPSYKIFVIETQMKQNLIRNTTFSTMQYDPVNGLIDLRHNRRANVCFLDGHVSMMDAPPLPRIKDIPTANAWMLKDTDPPTGF